jgi:hypothetical protein
MFAKDHPPPHFHVRYGEHRTRVEIATGELLDGELPPRAHRLIREWAELRRDELAENWRRTERMLQPEKVEPLP